MENQWENVLKILQNSIKYWDGNFLKRYHIDNETEPVETANLLSSNYDTMYNSVLSDKEQLR